jgi:hypothetical protein
MFAPVAVENITFPQQSLLDWSAFENNQWNRAGTAYFTSTNDVSYASATLVGTTNVCASATMASNGKIYAGPESSANIVVLDTNNDTISTIGTSIVNSYSAFYNDYTKKAYLCAGAIYVIDTTNDTYSGSIALAAGTLSMFSGLGLDGRYAYGTGWFTNRSWQVLDMINGVMTTTGVSSAGDNLNGSMGQTGKIYAGCGGSSTGIKVYDPANNTTEAIGPALSYSDSYRDVVPHPDGNLYSFPAFNGSQPILRITPRASGLTDTVTALDSINGTTYLTFRLCVGADGVIYGVGASNNLVSYDPRNAAFAVETLPLSSWKWIKMGIGGDLYMQATTGAIYKKAINNPGRVLRPIQEMNGIMSRLQTA